ncbi:cysteine-rich neurotrophic factor [Plakobranchus ocellatus]|uniref:Cysteine-rich neurotrophic factor n=1 Tax=Plakobranchus ocellatus TaxID=259542 RepID=A0AAV4A017_9GAST|nr:cysteine-rich neurotrophic factor [Plakobranchus ocellatus]
MLQYIFLASVILSVAMATTDPEAAMCSDRCAAWDELNRQCVEEKGCWAMNGGEYNETVRDCIMQCWPIAAPCHNACHVAFTFCDKACPFNGQDESCFHTCYEDKFEEIKPQLPSQTVQAVQTQ